MNQTRFAIAAAAIILCNVAGAGVPAPSVTDTLHAQPLQPTTVEARGDLQRVPAPSPRPPRPHKICCL